MEKHIKEHIIQVLAEDIASEVEGVDEGRLYAELTSHSISTLAGMNGVELERRMEDVAKDELYDTIIEPSGEPNVPHTTHTKHNDESWAVVEQVADLLYSILH